MRFVNINRIGFYQIFKLSIIRKVKKKKKKKKVASLNLHEIVRLKNTQRYTKGEIQKDPPERLGDSMDRGRLPSKYHTSRLEQQLNV